MNMHDATTPLMKQYVHIKKEYPSLLLLFQVGDFYELFYDDAKTVAAFLGITLTSRGKNNGEAIPLCGVPVHAIEFYLAKLVRGGFHVALCDQLEEPKPGKIVKRGVTRVLTPGTLTDSNLLNAQSASYLLTVFPARGQWGLLFAELLTAQLFATVIPEDARRVLEAELVRFFPDEIVLPQNQKKDIAAYLCGLGYCVSCVIDDEINKIEADNWMQAQFEPQIYSLIKQRETINHSLQTFYSYLKKTQERALPTFKQLRFYQPDDYLFIDAATQRNLELVRNNQDSTKKNTLLEILDNAATPMGSRMVKKWIVRPSLEISIIQERQMTVELLLHNNGVHRYELQKVLRSIGDLERIVGRIALWRASQHDYIALKSILHTLPALSALLENHKKTETIQFVIDYAKGFDGLSNLLETALEDSLESSIIIKKGFDHQLDTLRAQATMGHETILALEQVEQKNSGINSLKIRYNQVHGYYIEITKANLSLVPDYYIRHQTLVGKERFTTVELKRLEAEMLAARGQVESVEQELFERIKREVVAYVPQLRKLAHAIANFDALLGFAHIAYEREYSRPTFNKDNSYTILAGRHPVIDKHLTHRFIANDLILNEQERLLIITGPNMGGKSTYLRQGALMVIMAQCGSWVPAQKADLPLVDRIFTRIGAGDNVAEGKSTFLVEIEETKIICDYATERSLVILDELGRGTSTFDGLAIAQAVVEYIYQVVKARCLFATHYHALTTLTQQYPGIVNYYAASKRTETGLLLLYKIIKGTADGSFGIDIAKLAQLPKPIIDRAYEILSTLQTQEIADKHEQISFLPTTLHKDELQRLQNLNNQLHKKIHVHNSTLKALQELDLNELSPKQLFDIIWKLKQQMQS